eukprot:scaffold189453_cov11-Prasinocladus_malaysianus.AAC.1
MAAELAVAARLPVGSTRDESLLLMRQTEEAASALDLLRASDVLDVRPGEGRPPFCMNSELLGS